MMDDFKDNSPFIISSQIITQAAQDPDMKKAIIQFEYKLVQLYAHKLGLVILPSETKFYEWHGMMCVPAGLYAPAKLKFILTFPPLFPIQKPTIQLLKPIYHPLISQQDGYVDLDRVLTDWKYGQDCMLYNLLMAFADIFLDIQYFEIRDSHNSEAADMYRTNFKQYCDTVSQQVQETNEKVYASERDFVLKFNKPNDQMRYLLNKLEEINEKQGLSFQDKKRLLLQQVFQSKSN